MKWIDINFQRPSPQLDDILVYSINKNIHVVRWKYNSWLLWETDEGFFGENIEFTHWMTLPEPPTESQNKEGDPETT